MNKPIHIEPAFPVSITNAATGHQDGSSTWQFPGMTLRDYFAAKAMQGLLAHPVPVSPDDVPDLAADAYVMADAMLKARTA